MHSSTTRRWIAIQALTVMVAALGLGLSGCSTAPETAQGRQNLRNKAQTQMSKFMKRAPGLKSLMNQAVGYAMFPSVAKGGAIVGGASGQGVVFQNGDLIGYSRLSQASIGAQLGGQSYAELILFQNQRTLNQFKNGDLSFSANASAVALKSGAARRADFTHGTVVFTGSTAGLMFEASISGQKFSFNPVGQGQVNNGSNNGSMNDMNGQ